MTVNVDRTVFEKSMEEKWKLYNFKKEMGKTRSHKFELQFKGAF